jgi:hypothetical protein
MKTLSWSAGVALLAVALCAPDANAVTVKCQRTIAKASSQFVQAKMKAMQKCEDAIIKGSITGPCPDAKAAASITKASDKLAASIGKTCGGADKVCGGDLTGEDTPASLDWPATCPSIAGASCEADIFDCGDIADCLRCNGEAEVDQTIALYYDALAPHGGDKAIQKCQAAIGKASAAFVASKTKALQKCWDGRLNGKHTASCVPPAGGDGKYLAAIQKAQDKKTSTICKACGGADKTCDGVDDLTVAQIGFVGTCPAGDGSCAAPIATVADIDTCTYCVSEFAVDCTDQATVPQYVPYPVAACTEGCGAVPASGACPTTLEFTADGRNVDLDTGFTGLAQDAKVPTNGRLTLNVSNCDAATHPNCGECDVAGPIVNAGGPESANQRCQDAPWLLCSDDMDCTDQGATGPCIFFFGAPLPLVAGGVSTCVINEVASTVSGTINIGDGTSSTNVPLRSKVHPTGTAFEPCPRCASGACTAGPRFGMPCTIMGTGLFGDVSLDCPPDPGANAGTLNINLVIATGQQTRTVSTANPVCRAAGNNGGMGSLCAGGANDAMPCSAESACPGGQCARRCLCDTCNNANADGCATNADCPISGGNPGVCGGRRCIGGSNNGEPCAANSECPSGACGRPGEPTQPNACIDDTTTVGVDERICQDIGDNEGECQIGPIDQVCSIQTFKSCFGASDCNPPSAGGTCAECFAGQTCTSVTRPCFTDSGIIGNTVTVEGSADLPCGSVARPTVGTFFCVAPVSAPAVNAAGGLPALGRVRIPGTVELFP